MKFKHSFLDYLVAEKNSQFFISCIYIYSTFDFKFNIFGGLQEINVFDQNYVKTDIIFIMHNLDDF